MNQTPQAEKKSKLHRYKFGSKDRRFYASAAAMLALILAPFALYAALSSENQVLSAVFFAIIACSMLLVVIIS